MATRGRKRTLIPIGSQFGEWTVLENDIHDAQNHSCVKARCSCGREKILQSYNLTYGRTTQCKPCMIKKSTFADYRVGE